MNIYKDDKGEQGKYDGQKVLIGLSGGINSMAVLCWLIESGELPAELHLYYAHFKEHSPDTFKFVADGIRMARKHFPKVIVKISKNSVLAYFEKFKMIPHPVRSTCSYHLKIAPMEAYCLENGISIDLIGYVKTETKRIKRMLMSGANNLFITKDFPIGLFTDDWCFEIVDRWVGWHPAIYDIKSQDGTRIFKHNNCLPCKNMYVKDMKAVAEHFPEHMKNAVALSNRLKAYWGRDVDAYYTEFGREDFEPGQCEVCSFD